MTSRCTMPARARRPARRPPAATRSRRRRGPAAGSRAEQRRQRLAVDQLHHQVGGVAPRRRSAVVVDGDDAGWSAARRAAPRRGSGRGSGVVGHARAAASPRRSGRAGSWPRQTSPMPPEAMLRQLVAPRERHRRITRLITASITAWRSARQSPPEIASRSMPASWTSTATAISGSSAGANEMNQA